MNRNTLCCTCGTRVLHDRLSLFHPGHTHLRRWMFNHLSIEVVKDDSRPQRICIDCLLKVGKWVTFRSSSAKMQKKVKAEDDNKQKKRKVELNSESNSKPLTDGARKMPDRKSRKISELAVDTETPEKIETVAKNLNKDQGIQTEWSVTSRETQTCNEYFQVEISENNNEEKEQNLSDNNDDDDDDASSNGSPENETDPLEIDTGNSASKITNNSLSTQNGPILYEKRLETEYTVVPEKKKPGRPKCAVNKPGRKDPNAIKKLRTLKIREIQPTLTEPDFVEVKCVPVSDITIFKPVPEIASHDKSMNYNEPKTPGPSVIRIKPTSAFLPPTNAEHTSVIQYPEPNKSNLQPVYNEHNMQQQQSGPHTSQLVACNFQIPNNNIPFGYNTVAQTVQYEHQYKAPQGYQPCRNIEPKGGYFYQVQPQQQTTQFQVYNAPQTVNLAYPAAAQNMFYSSNAYATINNAILGPNMINNMEQYQKVNAPSSPMLNYPNNNMQNL